MIKLLKPLNRLGGLVKAGTILSLGENEAALVEAGAAEYLHPEIVKPELKKEFEPKPRAEPNTEKKPESKKDKPKPKKGGKK